MAHQPSPPALGTSHIFYGEDVSEQTAVMHIHNLRGDGWRVLASPFLVDSRRVTLFHVEAKDAEPTAISSTSVEIWAFVLHRFFYK
jgi:hypothetical protein